jgi:hypothetical protein
MIIPAPSKETHIKIIAQVLFNYISDYKAENYFTGKFKMFVNSFIVQLKEVEKKNFDRALELQEEAATIVYDALDVYLKTVSSVPVWDMPNITQVIQAYYLDKKSIEGITKKILK